MENLAVTRTRAKCVCALLLLVVVATMSASPQAVWAQAIPFTSIATVCAATDPGNSANGGLAYQASLNRFIVQCDRLLWSVDAITGASTPFAQSCGLTLQPPGEKSLTVSTGLGGFPSDFIYVADGNTIVQIDPTGTSCSTLTTLPGPTFVEKVALTFDYNSTAPFSNQLVAVEPNGNVWRIDSAGTPTSVGSIGATSLYEDAKVTPPTYPGGLADEIITAADDGAVSGTVFAISSGGGVTTVGSVPLAADSLCILPPTILSSGAPNGVFSVQSDSFLYQAVASAFASLGNNIVVGPENGGQIYTIDPSPPGFPKPVTVHSASTCPSGFCFEQNMVCILEKCPRTQGFWKNHPSAWPVTSLVLGGTLYTQTQLLAILSAASAGDASLILAKQLIAAKLDISSGANPAQVSTTIATADALLTGCNLNLGPGCGVSSSSATGQAMIAAASVLDTYNNGQFTPHCQP